MAERWSDAETEQLKNEVARGLPDAEIARLHKRNPHAIEQKRFRLGLTNGRKFVTSEPPDPVAVWKALNAANAAEVQRKADAYDWLQPVQLPAPPKPKTTSTPAPFVLVAGDMHFGMQDDRACAVFLAAVEAIKPRLTILNGDTVDLLAVSRWPKDARIGKTWTLRDEVTAFHSFLHTLHSVGNAWGMEVVETSANHSGNGTDGRWWRYLNEHVPELLQHHEAEQRLSYQSWFFPEWSNITLKDSVMVADELLVLHGDIVRTEAAYSAKASREKWGNSVLVNHTHRVGLSPKTIPAIQGKAVSYVRAYENGCLCKLEVPYGRALNWQQSFAVVCESPGLFGVEQVFIDNGRANVSALGRTLAA